MATQNRQPAEEYSRFLQSALSREDEYLKNQLESLKIGEQFSQIFNHTKKQLDDFQGVLRSELIGSKREVLKSAESLEKSNLDNQNKIKAELDLVHQRNGQFGDKIINVTIEATVANKELINNLAEKLISRLDSLSMKINIAIGVAGLSAILAIVGLISKGVR